MRIVPIAPNIPELNINTIDKYLKSVDLYINRIDNIEKVEINIQTLKINIQQAFERAKINDFDGAKQILENVRNSYERILNQERYNPDLGTILDVFLNYICTDYLKKSIMDQETTENIQDIIARWNEICQRYNLIYINNNEIKSVSEEFYNELEIDTVKDITSKRSHTISLGKFLAFLGSKIFISTFLGVVPNHIDFTIDALQDGSSMGLFHNFKEKVIDFTSTLFNKITTSSPQKILLEDFNKEKTRIDKINEEGYELLKKNEWNKSLERFKLAFNEYKQLRKKKITGTRSIF